MEGSADRLRPSRFDHAYLQLLQLARQLRSEADLLGAGLTIDVGCGAKPYRSLFKGSYIGFDLTRQHGEPDAQAAAERLPLRDRCADVVISTQQLEHVDDPRRVLDEVFRITSPGGHFLLSTHGVWPYHPDPVDLWRWTEEGLRRVVSDSGFTVDRIHHQGELLSVAALLAMYPLAGAREDRRGWVRVGARLMLFLANMLAVGLDRVSRLLPRHYASASYLVVARRPSAPPLKRSA